MSFLKACREGNVAAVQDHLEDPDPNTLLARDDYCRNGILLASLYGHYDIVKMLLLCDGIEKTAIARYGCSSLHLASLSDTPDIRIIELLLDSGLFDINSQNCYGDTALLYAAQKNNVEIARRLLKVPQINVNVPDFDGITPFLVSIIHGNLDMIELFLQDGRCDVNLRTFDGRTAMHLAVTSGFHGIIRRMLSLINVFDCDLKANTVAHCACSTGDMETIEILMGDPRISFSILNDDGETPFMIACLVQKPNRMDIVRLMMRMGHHYPCIRNDNGKTVVHLACESNDPELVQVLLEDHQSRNLVFESLSHQLESCRRENVEYEMLLGQAVHLNESLRKQLQEKSEKLDSLFQVNPSNP